MERFFSALRLTLLVIPAVSMSEMPGRSGTSFASSTGAGI